MLANTDINGIPVIDPNVRHVGVSKLRTLNAERLRALDKTLVIQDPDDMPLAVMLRYEQYLEIQRVLATLEEFLAHKNGLNASQDSSTKSLSEVRRSLRKVNQKRLS